MGYAHPDALLGEISSRQFAEWMSWYANEPFGEQRADLRAAIVAAVMSNRWRGKSERPLKPLDFMPFLKKRQQTPEEMRAVLRGVLASVNHGANRNNQH